MKSQARGAIEMISAMVISGTVGWFVVMSGQPPESVVFWRCLFGALAMLAVCGWLGQLRRGLLSRRQAGLCVLGGVALALNWTLLFGAYGHASISVATIVYHTQPFMLVALGALCFKEKPGARKLACLALAFGGLAAIVAGRPAAALHAGGSFATGVALALGAAFFYAIAAIIAKGLKGVPPHLIVLIQLLIGAALMSPSAALPDQPRAWGLLVAIGVVHTGLMSTLLYSALQKTATSLIGVLSFIYPIVAMLVDALAFDQRMNAIQIAGAALILLSAAAMNRPARAGGPAEADVDRQS